MLPVKGLAMDTSPCAVCVSCTEQAQSDDGAQEMGGVTVLGSAPSPQPCAARVSLGCKSKCVPGSINTNFLNPGVLVASSSNKRS